MEKKEPVKADWRNKDWQYLKSDTHNNSDSFKERMKQRRAETPVLSHYTVINPTEKQ